MDDSRYKPERPAAVQTLAACPEGKVLLYLCCTYAASDLRSLQGESGEGSLFETRPPASSEQQAVKRLVELQPATNLTQPMSFCQSGNIQVHVCLILQPTT